MAVSESRFVQLIEEHLGLDRCPVMTDRLVDDLQLDSLARLELWVAFEMMAGRWVEPGALDACETVSDLYHFANQLLDDPK